MFRPFQSSFISRNIINSRHSNAIRMIVQASHCTSTLRPHEALQGGVGVEVEANCNCVRKWEAPTPAGASVLTIRISFYGCRDCDSTICISVCSHIYLTNLFAATGKYNPSVIREKNAVLINQANISRPLALYAIRTVVSLLVIFHLKITLLAIFYSDLYNGARRVYVKSSLDNMKQYRAVVGWPW